MTPSPSRLEKPAVILTRRQLESVIYNMGWEPEDEDAFLELAQREMRDPGILGREAAAYFHRAMQSDGD